MQSGYPIGSQTCWPPGKTSSSTSARWRQRWAQCLPALSSPSHVRQAHTVGQWLQLQPRLQNVRCNPLQSVSVQEKSGRESSATDGMRACCAAECAVHIGPIKLSQSTTDRDALPQ